VPPNCRVRSDRRRREAHAVAVESPCRALKAAQPSNKRKESIKKKTVKPSTH